MASTTHVPLLQWPYGNQHQHILQGDNDGLLPLPLQGDLIEGVQNVLLKMYREKPDVSVLLELLTDIDEGIQEWRYRHVKLAERTIGAKIGTGGSDGVEFLKRTLFTPLFPDLWAIRSEM